MTLDKRALDAWITREPEWSPQLITVHDTEYGHDTAEVCAWCACEVGLHEAVEGDTDTATWVRDYWQLDEDDEIRVCVRCYEESQDYDEYEHDEYYSVPRITHASDSDYAHWGEEASIIRNAENPPYRN